MNVLFDGFHYISTGSDIELLTAGGVRQSPQPRDRQTEGVAAPPSVISADVVVPFCCADCMRPNALLPV